MELVAVDRVILAAAAAEVAILHAGGTEFSVNLDAE